MEPSRLLVGLCRILFQAHTAAHRARRVVACRQPHHGVRIRVAELELEVETSLFRCLDRYIRQFVVFLICSCLLVVVSFYAFSL